MTALMAKVEVRGNKRSEFIKIMQEVAIKTKEKYNCEQFEIYQHLENENVFSFFSIWKNPNDFRKHLESDQFSMLLIALKLLRKNPEIRYFKNQMGMGLRGLIQLRDILGTKQKNY